MGNTLRFHIHGLHHTQTNKYFNSCAFTMQIHAMCDMLTKAGHEVYHYGNEGSDPNCTENIIIATEKERYASYPLGDFRKAQPFFGGPAPNVGYNAAPEYCDEWDRRVIEEIGKRIKPNDFILNFCNTEYMAISNAFEDLAILVEPGVGYAGGCPNTRKVYVSHTWQAFHDGWNARGITDYTDEDWYFGKPEIQDAVIHYFIDEEDFEYSADKKNYAFFIGRFNDDKGVNIALHTCEAYRNDTGDKSFKLKMAGPGSEWFVDLLTEEQKEWVEVLGFVEPEEKKDLLKKAKVLFAPSLYNEPFGAISIEAQISGTPVISTDWGGFPESVIHGKTGYRCRNFEHFVWALKNIDKINSQDCYTWASNNFTKEAMTPKYVDYFKGLYNMRTNDTQWWTPNNDRKSLDTCQMYYPNPKVKVVTSYYKYDEEEMKHLINSCKKHQITWEVVGEGKTMEKVPSGDEVTPKTVERIKWYQEYFNKQQEDDNTLIICLDAYDTFFIDGLKEIHDKFIKQRYDIIFSAERAYSHQNEGFVKEQWDKLGTSKIYKYINAGAFMGTLSQLRKLFNDIVNQLRPEDIIDMTILSDYLCTRMDNYNTTLDYDCEFFYTPVEDWDEWKDDVNLNFTFKDGLYLHRTKSSPSMVHVPFKYFKDGRVARLPMLEHLYGGIYD